MTKDYDDPLAKIVSGNIDLNWLTKEALRKETREPLLPYNPNLDKTDDDIVKYSRSPEDKGKGITGTSFGLGSLKEMWEAYRHGLDAQDLADRETRRRRGIEEFKLPNKLGMDSNNPEYPYAPQLPPENKSRLELDPYQELLRLLSKK